MPINNVEVALPSEDSSSQHGTSNADASVGSPVQSPVPTASASNVNVMASQPVPPVDLPEYRELSGQLVLVKKGKTTSYTSLSNFTARIVANVVKDDDSDPTHLLEVEAKLGARIERFKLTSAEFEQMSWPAKNLGGGGGHFPWLQR